MLTTAVSTTTAAALPVASATPAAAAPRPLHRRGTQLRLHLRRPGVLQPGRRWAGPVGARLHPLRQRGQGGCRRGDDDPLRPGGHRAEHVHSVQLLPQHAERAVCSDQPRRQPAGRPSRDGEAVVQHCGQLQHLQRAVQLCGASALLRSGLLLRRRGGDHAGCVWGSCEGGVPQGLRLQLGVRHAGPSFHGAQRSVLRACVRVPTLCSRVRLVFIRSMLAPALPHPTSGDDRHVRLRL